MHELAHVVAGSGECRAMLFEFWVAFDATGTYAPNDYYWNLNKCYARGFGWYLPGKGEIIASVDDKEPSPLSDESKPLTVAPDAH
jgi:hypothetical protein